MPMCAGRSSAGAAPAQGSVVGQGREVNRPGEARLLVSITAVPLFLHTGDPMNNTILIAAAIVAAAVILKLPIGPSPGRYQIAGASNFLLPPRHDHW